MTLWRLEVLRMVRTHRWAMVVGVYVVFGVLGPITARYLGELVGNFAGDITIVVPDPRPVDGVAQFVSNATQLGLLAVVIVAASALAVDARTEVAAFLRTRVAHGRVLLWPRYVVVTLTAVVALVAGTAVAWVLTATVLGPLPAGTMLIGTVLGALYLAFAVAVVAAAGSVARGVVPTVFAARQFVNHGHVLVNGKRVNIPSYRVNEGDVIEVREKSKQMAAILEASQLPERDVPDYIDVDHSKLTATFVRTPGLGDVPYPVHMEPNLVIEFYAQN